MSETAVSDLADAHRLDDHRVEARRFDQQHRLARAPRHTAQGGAGRRRPDEGGRLA